MRIAGPRNDQASLDAVIRQILPLDSCGPLQGERRLLFRFSERFA